MKKRIAELPWWASLILPIVVVVLGLVISQFSNLIDMRTTLISGVIVIVLVIISSLVGSLIAKNSLKDDLIEAENNLNEKAVNLEKQIQGLEGKINALSQIPDILLNRINALNDSISELKIINQNMLGRSLINYEQLASIEKGVEEKEEIWVLTSHLQLEDAEFRELIIDNLRRGIVYKYLLPLEDLDLQRTMIELMQNWQEQGKLTNEDIQRQVQCFLVPKHLTYMTVVIYGPHSAKNPTVIVKFPESETYEKGKYPFIYKVDIKPRAGIDRFIELIYELMDDQQYCPLVRKLPTNNLSTAA
jgi:hypothetical protein